MAVGAGRVVGPAGRAAGLGPVVSLSSVQPLDETGNLTPAWSLKVQVMLVVVALTCACRESRPRLLPAELPARRFRP